MSKRVQPDSFLTLHYRIGLIDGGDVVNTFIDKPATLQLGNGEFAPTLEQALVGLEEGQQASMTLEPAAAFGERNPDLLQHVSLATLNGQSSADEDYAEGDWVEFNAPSGGRMAGRLKSFEKDSALFDFNHPLAGQTLVFEACIIGIL